MPTEQINTGPRTRADLVAVKARIAERQYRTARPARTLRCLKIIGTAFKYLAHR